MTTSAPEQPVLTGVRLRVPRSTRSRAAPPMAEQDPVAAVLVDTGLAHLDRPFDYLVPASMDAGVRPGVRVRVRFAGQDLDGFVTARRAESDHARPLTPLRRLVSPEIVLTPAVLAAAQSLAADHAGTVGDVLRLAIPARHGAAEKAADAWPSPPPTPPQAPEVTETSPGTAPMLPDAWDPYAGGAAFLRHVRDGAAPHAAVAALPGRPPGLDWPALLAQAASAAVSGGRQALIVVPDHRDVARVESALRALPGAPRHTRLTAEQGPHARYTAFLKALRGQVDVVVGTRAAAWAPLPRLGLALWWDDGDDLLEEPRFPHIPVRDILLRRAGLQGAAVLAAGFARSVSVQSLIEREVLTDLLPQRTIRAASLPRVRVAGEGHDQDRDPAVAAAHLPSVAWHVAKAALSDGPVLVQVPRRGYLPSLSCVEGRHPARCPQCAGPLALGRPGTPPSCRWCGRLEPRFRCPQCGDPRVRAAVIGARRTAEDLGRAFPGTIVDRSGADVVLAQVPAGPRLVVATPGAEPLAPDGYAAVLLLDAWALLDRPGLSAHDEALRRWLAAAALARPGATVVLAGAPPHAALPPVEALVRWAPTWFAQQALAERSDLRLPPSSVFGAVIGQHAAVTSAVGSMELPADARVFGPVPTGGADERFRLLVQVDPTHAGALAREFKALRARQSARKDPDPVRVRLPVLDPLGA